MSSKKRTKKQSPISKSSSTSAPSNLATAAASTSEELPSASYLISCDIPTKQFIQYLDELKPQGKKFIIQDLDATHLLVKVKAKEEIERKVEEWLDENVYSAVERVGEDLDMS
jgi:TFIIH basal transcription factor complex TTD-A subunit